MPLSNRRPEQLKLAVEQDELGRQRRANRRARLEEHGDQFAAWWSNEGGYKPPVRLITVPLEQQISALKSALLESGGAGEQKLRAIQVVQSRGTPWRRARWLALDEAERADALDLHRKGIAA